MNKNNRNEKVGKSKDPTYFGAADSKSDNHFASSDVVFYLGHTPIPIGALPLPIVVGLVLTFVGMDNRFWNHNYLALK